MSKLIDGQAAIDALCDNCDNMQAVCPHYPCKQYTAIEALPHAQPDIPTNTPNTPTNTPTDCISRQAVYDALITEPLKWDDSSVWESARCHQWMMDMDVIKALPSAQPEIIRCKDCRYYQDNNGGYPHMNCKWDANETPNEDDFCSGAERKEGEAE